MSRPLVQITATCAGGQSLRALSETIAARQRYLNETAFQSVHATAVNALKSIRAATRVAKPAGISVSVAERADLKFSYTYRSAAATGSRACAKMGLRNLSGVRIEDGSMGKIMFHSCHGLKTSAVRVFQFVDRPSADASKVYLIAAPSPAKARACAQRIVARRVLQFSGLAKRAVSVLMVKTNNKGPSDIVSFRTDSVARSVRKSGSSGVFALVVRDDLRYAGRALKGGPAAVDLALKKAANASVGRIRQKCDRLLLPGELPTPFPEVTRRSA